MNIIGFSVDFTFMLYFLLLKLVEYNRKRSLLEYRVIEFQLKASPCPYSWHLFRIFYINQTMTTFCLTCINVEIFSIFRHLQVSFHLNKTIQADCRMSGQCWMTMTPIGCHPTIISVYKLKH